MARRARAMHEIFFENLRNPARFRRASAMRQFPTGQLDSTGLKTSVGQDPSVGRFLKLAQKYLDITVNHYTTPQKLVLT